MKLLGSADPRAGRRRYGRRWLIRALVAGAVLSAAGLPLSGTSAAPARAAGAGTTVEGPNVWIPNRAPGDPVLFDGTDFATGTYGDPGTLTVDQTQDLGNQVVHVSWTGFTPTVDGASNTPVTVIGPDATGSAMYAVRVYECRGTNPLITDCYGSSLYNQDSSKGFEQGSPAAGTTAPDFASNSALAVTRPDGTGDANIEIWTSRESQSLGCDTKHACSIVVEPNYGGDPLGYVTGDGVSDCSNHFYDSTASLISPSTATDGIFTAQDPAHQYQEGERCAWNDHVVVPLSFGPSTGNCKAGGSSFSAEGLPMFTRAAQQWIIGACLSKSPVTVQYSSGLTEPIARTDFLQGVNSDVAFTARPADPTLPHAHPFVYAPMANSAIAVVFIVDDPATGQQVLNLKLNARLLAKMLTQSYTQNYDNSLIKSVVGNPGCIFADPEFLQLNSSDANGITWPDCSGQAKMPIVTAGQTDFVYQVTSWIAADPDSRAFLQGAADPWGMHVDTYYLPSKFSGYPVDSFVPQDQSGYDNLPDSDPLAHYKSFEWNPLGGGLSQVARNLLQNTPTCLVYGLDNNGQHVKCPVQVLGNRALFAILDSGQVAAYRMPTASLENPAGQFVQPTLKSMSAAVGDMVTDKATATQSMPYGAAGTSFSKDPDAYPLTTVQYAMLPTGGVKLSKAAKIAQFIQTITSTAGQVYGNQPGELAPGFLALTPAQQAQAATAALRVAGQDDTPATVKPPGRSGNGGSGSGSGSGSGTGVRSSTPLPRTTPDTGSTPAPTAKSQSLGPLAVTGVAHPDQADAGRLVLPIALIAGLALLVAGPLGALLLGTGAGASLMNRVRRAASGRR